jgi:hypothetical protein
MNPAQFIDEGTMELFILIGLSIDYFLFQFARCLLDIIHSFGRLDGEIAGGNNRTESRTS